MHNRPVFFYWRFWRMLGQTPGGYLLGVWLFFVVYVFSGFRDDLSARIMLDLLTGLLVGALVETARMFGYHEAFDQAVDVAQETFDDLMKQQVPFMVIGVTNGSDKRDSAAGDSGESR